MKTLLIIIPMILLAMNVFVPRDQLIIPSKQTVTCTIAYSEDEETIVYEDSLAHCNLVEIRSVPPAEITIMPVKAIFIKGSYDIKYSSPVPLEHGYDYVLEDQLTGTTYNLRSETAYHFNVSRTIPTRFMLRIKKSSSVTSR